MSAKRNSQKIELRPDENPPPGHDGFPAMDEVCAANVDIHFERMNDSAVWVGITAKDGSLVHVWLTAKKGRLYFGAEEQ